MDDFDEAGSFQRLGRHREAIERYSYVVTRYPESELAPKSQLKAASNYDKDLKDDEKAIAAYSALFFMYPDSAETVEGREALAELYSGKGEHRSSIEEYQRLYESVPASRQRFQYLIAMEYMRMGDLRQARAELVELNNIVANPGLSPRIRMHIAETYHIEGMYSEALRRYDEIIGRFPESQAAEEAAMAKAAIYEDEGSYAEALRVLYALKGKKELPGLDERISALKKKTGKRGRG